MSLARRWWWRLLVGVAAFATTCFLLLGIQHPINADRQLRGKDGHRLLHRDSHGTKSNYTILLWTSFYGDWNYLRFGNNTCSVSCQVTSDRSQIEDVQALVFHVRNMDLVDLPSFRSPEQQWIFYCLESPEYSYFTGFHHMQGMFNWTMTYRRDSDIVIPYGFVKTKKTKGLAATSTAKLQLFDLSLKKKLTFWLVSHCKTAGLREDYVAELSKWTKVDIYGKCGQVTCQRDQGNLCFQELSNHYKFVLAFENSFCKDYATEKFFKALRYNVVPVVYGGANYAKIAPPNSYIDALSFSNPKQLAEYLEKVNSNTTLYESYLAWKKDYDVEMLMHQTLCKLCHKLHYSKHATKSYPDMYNWWVDEGQCRKWMSK